MEKDHIMIDLPTPGQLRKLAKELPVMLETDAYNYSKKHKLWVDSFQWHLRKVADILEKEIT